eukprot:4418956-Prymnesium_polylepis.1
MALSVVLLVVAGCGFCLQKTGLGLQAIGVLMSLRDEAAARMSDVLARIAMFRARAKLRAMGIGVPAKPSHARRPRAPLPVHAALDYDEDDDDDDAVCTGAAKGKPACVFGSKTASPSGAGAVQPFGG